MTADITAPRLPQNTRLSANAARLATGTPQRRPAAGPTAGQPPAAAWTAGIGLVAHTGEPPPQARYAAVPHRGAQHPFHGGVQLLHLAFVQAGDRPERMQAGLPADFVGEQVAQPGD